MNKRLVANIAAILFGWGIFTSHASITDSTAPSQGLSIGYRQNLSFTLAGVQVGMERDFFRNAKYAVIGCASVIAEWKPAIYAAGGITVGNALRRTFTFGVFLEQGVEVGYLGRHYHFDFYEINPDGDIVNIGRPWKSSFIGGGFIGAGYDFLRLTPLNLQLFFKPSLYLKMPDDDNIFQLHNRGFEAGLIVHPKWLHCKNRTSRRNP